MAIVQLRVAGVLNKVIDGILYTSPPGTPLRMQKANNNRSHSKNSVAKAISGSSSYFQNLDAQITNLDGQYDMLRNQIDWVTYAGNITGEWQLCANCQPDSSGKKLYRQYNFNRSASGLPEISTPVSNTAYSAPMTFQVTWNYPGIGTGDNIDFSITAHPHPQWIQTQLGIGSTNPVFFFDGSTTGVFFPGSPQYDYFVGNWVKRFGHPSAGFAEFTFQTCVWDANGAPGLKAVYPMFAQPS